MVSARIERFGSEKAVAGDYVFVDQADEDAQGDEVVDGDVPEGGADEADAMDVDAVAPGEQEESEVIVETESVKNRPVVFQKSRFSPKMKLQALQFWTS